MNRQYAHPARPDDDEPLETAMDEEDEDFDDEDEEDEEVEDDSEEES
jgi:hypothetical protein